MNLGRDHLTRILPRSIIPVALHGSSGRTGIRLAPIDGDLLRQAVPTNRLGEEVQGRPLVPRLRQQKGNGLAGFIHRPIVIVPLPFHLDGGLVYAPAAPHRSLAAVKHLFELGTVFQDQRLIVA
jgi:hypothetical protein